MKQLAFSTNGLRAETLMVTTVKPLLVWFSDIAWDPLTVIAASLVAAAAPLVIVSRSKGPRPNLKVVEARPDPAPSVPVISTAEPAPAGQHWQRLTGVIASNIAAARTATDLQVAARVKLDAADFTLSQIMKDLAEVIPGLSGAEAMRPAAISIGRRRLAA